MKRIPREMQTADSIPYSPTVEYRPIQADVNGRIVTRFERCEIDPLEVNKGLSADDFKLDVLIATNSVDLLKDNQPLRMSFTSILNETNKIQ